MFELIQQLKRHEGFRPTPYKCSAGYLTIGYGRNLDTNGVSEEEATKLLINDIERCQYELIHNIPFWSNLDLHVQYVLINMCVNMGIVGVLGFKKMLKALEQCDRKEAARQIRNSKYYSQVHNRAEELAQIIESGL